MHHITLSAAGGAASLHFTERQTPPRIDRPADQQDNLVIKIKIVPALHKHCWAADLSGQACCLLDIKHHRLLFLRDAPYPHAQEFLCRNCDGSR
jgi:hypothetical protein